MKASQTILMTLFLWNSLDFQEKLASQVVKVYENWKTNKYSIVRTFTLKYNLVFYRRVAYITLKINNICSNIFFLFSCYFITKQTQRNKFSSKIPQMM